MIYSLTSYRRPPCKEPSPIAVNARFVHRLNELVEEADRLEDLAEANREVIERAKATLDRFGLLATASMRADLDVAYAEDARLVKAWLALAKDRGRIEREMRREASR